METTTQLLSPGTRTHAVRRTYPRFLCVPLLFACATSLAFAQPARVTTIVPVRQLNIREKSPQVFANIFQVRQIANQQVLVNDGLRRQLILLDPALTFSRIVLDSVSSASGERYRPVAVPIIPALADNTLFIDRETYWRFHGETHHHGNAAPRNRASSACEL